MSKSLTVFDPNQMPSHIAEYFETTTGNVQDRTSVPSLAYGGKRWTIAIGGEKTQLMKKDDDGDDVPVNVVKVVILDYAKERGRALYEGTYDPDKISAPICWSDDGKKAHPSIEEAPFDNWTGKCEGCPMSIKGSKVTDNNKQTYACSQHRMLAVVPSNKLDVLPPLRLKIAITSDWDKDNKENEAQDWYAFRQYLDFLRTRNIKDTAAVITKMKFDAKTDYPKLLFQAGGWTTEETFKRALELRSEPDTAALLGGSWTPAGVDGKKVPEKGKALPADEDDEEGPAPAPAPKAKAKPAIVDDDDEVIPPSKKSSAADKAKPVKATVVDDDEDEVVASKPAVVTPNKRAAAIAAAEAAAKKKPVAVADDEDDEPAPAPKAKAKAAVVDDEDDEPKPKAKAKPAVVDDDDDEPPAKSSAKPKAKTETPVPKGEVPKGVADLLNDWDED